MAVSEGDLAPAFVRNFNPLLEAGDVRWPTRRAMYEPMLVHNPLSGEYVPWLAERYVWNADRTELRFALRPGVLWSDGVPFTARDVVFTFELVRKHKALDLVGLWEHVAGVSAPDDTTVVVRLAGPHVPALEPVAHQPIVPAHVWRHIGDPATFANENPVATGPFTEVLFFKPQAYEIGRNPHYWQPGRPAVSALRFRAYASNEAVLLALVDGDLDWAGSFIPAVDRVFIARDPAHRRFWSPPIDAMVFLYANTTRPPFDDARVRKALSLAVDRSLLVNVAMHGYTRSGDASGLSDAYLRYRDATAVAAGDWVAYDVARAERLLDEAGLPRGRNGHRQFQGQDFAPTILVPAGYSDWVAAAPMIARGLRRIGIEAEVRINDFNAWFDRLQTGEFSLSLGWSGVTSTPYGVFRGLMSTATVRPTGEPAAENWHRFGLPAADAVLAALEATVDRGEENRLVAELQRLFAAHAPAIPLFPGPAWGECNERRFVGFPSADDPYAPLSPNLDPQSLLVITRIRPR
jgi:peptide/nickel transport system substrate-binding protein